MILEGEALEGLLVTLNPETKCQLRYLIKSFEEEETLGVFGQAEVIYFGR